MTITYKLKAGWGYFWVIYRNGTSIFEGGEGYMNELLSDIGNYSKKQINELLKSSLVNFIELNLTDNKVLPYLKERAKANHDVKAFLKHSFLENKMNKTNLRKLIREQVKLILSEDDTRYSMYQVFGNINKAKQEMERFSKLYRDAKVKLNAMEATIESNIESFVKEKNQLLADMDLEMGQFDDIGSAKADKVAQDYGTRLNVVDKNIEKEQAKLKKYSDAVSQAHKNFNTAIDKYRGATNNAKSIVGAKR